MAPLAKGWAGLTKLRFVPVKQSNVVAFTKQWTEYYEGKGEPVNRRDAEFFWAFEVRTNLPEGLEYERLLAQEYIGPIPLLNLNSSMRTKN